MNFAKFKDSVFHMCLAGVVVASWALTQEVAGTNPFNDKYLLSFNLLNLMKAFRKNSNVPNPYRRHCVQNLGW